MKRLGIKWRNSLLFIIIVSVALAAVCAIWTIVFEPELYLSRYVFTAGGDSERIAHDSRNLIRNSEFREDILTEIGSVGKTLVWICGPGHGSYITINVVGENRTAVGLLAQAVGQRLIDTARGTLGAASARNTGTVTTEILEKQPVFRCIAAAAAGFLLASLAAFFFGNPECFADETNDPDKFSVIERSVLSLGAARYAGVEKAAQASDSVRKTVLKLDAGPKDEGAGIYLMTGMVPNDVRAAASVFAAASALHRKRVLLIEIAAAPSERLVPHAISLQDYLEGRMALNGLLFRTSVNGLFYVNADMGAFEGTEIADGFLKFISGASQHFDSIYIALPSAVSEETYSAAASLNGEVLLLIRNGKCSEKYVRELANDFELLSGTVRKIYLK